MKDCIRHIALLLLALPMLLFSCTHEEPLPAGEDELTRVIPYRVTVEQEPQTRATLNGINQYIFQLGDELYITDGTGNIFGFLSLVAGEGASVATFEGELKCVNGAEPSSSTVLYATLVGVNDVMHTGVNGKITGNTASDLPKSVYSTSLAEAVEKYSEFTGTSTYGSHSFSLQQQMSFLIFSVTFDPANLPSEKKNGVSVTITSLNGDGEGDDVVLYTGGVPIPVIDNTVDLQSDFVVALPSSSFNPSSTLSNASVVFTYDSGTVEAGKWEHINKNLEKNNYYNFEKTQFAAACFTIEARQATSITFNYTYASHGIQYKYSDNIDGDWNNVGSDPIPLAAGKAIIVQGNAYKLKKGDNSEVLFTSADNNLCYIYGDIMTLLWGEGYDPSQKSLNPDGNGNNRNMFEGLFKNTNYIDIPSGRPLQLPDATTRQCYLSMFEGCTSLTRAPDLPASIVAEGAYQNMFKGCTGLTAAPELPASSVGPSGYREMFMDCTSLTSAPTSLSGTSNNYCCWSMFQGCTSLSFAPRLDATSIGDKGYMSMFKGCSSLLSAPDLPASTIGISSYEQMFMNCSSMTSAPTRLPAGELKNYCYKDMFNGCSLLTNAPVLPADNDVDAVPVECYYSMFRDCRSINRLPADLPLVKIGTSGCREMFYGCTKLVEAPELASLTEVGENGCYGMFYSCSELTTVPPALKPLSAPASAYREMFRNCPKITETPNIKAKQMGESACRSMFNSCIRLNKINGKLLPGTADRSEESLASYVYAYMFENCTSLATVSASFLPAMNLGPDCYRGMFKGSGLQKAPDLPAVTLTARCYMEMFTNCTALTGTVYLPAGNLVEDCYDNMFDGASQFNSLICLANIRTPWEDGGDGNDLRLSCTNWLRNTKSTGIFYYASGFGIKGVLAPDRGWVYPDNSGIRSGWTYKEFHLDPIFPPNNPFTPEEDL